MVINGGARTSTASYAAWLGRHLTRTDSNERVYVRKLDGVTADDLAEAIGEMSAMASGFRSKRGLAHFNIDWRHDEVLTDAQKARAVDRLAEEHGLTGQPCAVVEHVKAGREHLHVVFMRIDPETGKAIHDGHNYRRNEVVARELELEFGLERVQGVHVGREGVDRPARTPEDYEFAQAARSGITPEEARATLAGLWRSADTGQAFAAAIAAAGWSLAQGDKRDVVVALDPSGEAHPINKRLTGLTAKEVRARLADLDGLPSVDQARQAMRDRARDAAGPVLDPGAELGGMEVAGASPGATQRASYEVEPEPPADFEARFGPAGVEPTSPAPPASTSGAAYVPNFVLVPDRWGPSPEIDPEAGMEIDREADPVPSLEEFAFRQADEFSKQDAGRDRTPWTRPGREDREPDPQRGSLDAEARRAMEELARTDPHGMAARHGFHAGDRLKSPEDMRREWAERLRAASPGPGLDLGGSEVAGASPEATQRASQEVDQAAKPVELGRWAGMVAAARAKLVDLAHRLDVAFGRRRDQVLQADGTPRPRASEDTVDDNGAVILETMRQNDPKRSVADEILAAAKRRRQQDRTAEPTPEPEVDRSRSIWDEFGKRKRRPGEPTL